MSNDIERGRLQADFNILQNFMALQQEKLTRQMNSFSQAASLKKYDVVEDSLDNLLETSFKVKQSLSDADSALSELDGYSEEERAHHSIIQNPLDKISRHFEKNVAEYNDKKGFLTAAVEEVERAIVRSEIKKHNGVTLSESDINTIAEAFEPFISCD